MSTGMRMASVSRPGSRSGSRPRSQNGARRYSDSYYYRGADGLDTHEEPLEDAQGGLDRAELQRLLESSEFQLAQAEEVVTDLMKKNTALELKNQALTSVLQGTQQQLSQALEEKGRLLDDTNDLADEMAKCKSGLETKNQTLADEIRLLKHPGTDWGIAWLSFDTACCADYTAGILIEQRDTYGCCCRSRGRTAH